MSLVTKAVRGAAWTISASIATRAIGVIATLVLTRYLAPQVVGEIAAATIVVMTANQLSIIGFGQFLIARPDSGRNAVFHATVFNLAFGALAFGAVLWTMSWIASAVGAPGMTHYVPGLVLSAAITRIGFVPARLLARDMRFRVASVALGAGELSYAVASVALAMAGLGGGAVIAGNIARAVVSTAICLAAVDRRDWLTPCKLSRAQTSEMFRFGIPISLAALLSLISRRWDNLLFSALFGPAQMGLYNLAYNLADIPASHVGEHIGDVLLPSFARLPSDQRRRGFVRSTALLAVIVFPLAVGLGAVAPTLIALLLPPEWQAMAPLLVVLSVMGVVRPLGWTVSAYLQALDRPRLVMGLEAGKLAALGIGILAGAALGPVWSAAGVGLAFGAHSWVGLQWIARIEALSPRAILAPLLRPLIASAALTVAVLGARALAHSLGASPGPTLAAEITAGAVAYVAAALVVMPDRASEILALVRRAAGKEPASEAAPGR